MQYHTIRSSLIEKPKFFVTLKEMYVHTTQTLMETNLDYTQTLPNQPPTPSNSTPKPRNTLPNQLNLIEAKPEIYTRYRHLY